MGGLKDRMRTDLTSAMRSRDAPRTAALRMALTAVREEEVAGAAAHELSDEQVRQVLTREVRKRRESADAFAEAGRAELAARERAAVEVLAGYLPTQLSDEELATLVDRVLTERGLAGSTSMGPAMRAVTAVVAGRAEGGRVAAVVRARLAAG